MVNAHEEAIVRSFFVKGKRDRYLSLLGGKRRGEALDRLNHLWDLDPRYVKELASSADVLSLLRERGAPEKAYVLSDVPELDGREMPLAEVLEAINSGYDLGTIVSSIPGRLAYYHGEYGEQRILLER